MWYYEAPYGTSLSLRTIPEGHQEVDIITVGRDFYEYQGGTVEAVLGTILWHDPGEETIYKNEFENPYECIVIAFCYSSNSGLKGLYHWTDRVSLQVFIYNVLNEYHSENSDMAKLSYKVFGQLGSSKPQSGNLSSKVKDIRISRMSYVGSTTIRVRI